MIERLLSQPYRFSFFQAVMLLEARRRGCVPLGHQGPPGEEALRLRSELSMAFPKSDLFAIENLNEEEAPHFRLTVSFMGLYGTTSPLPNFYTELIIADEQEGGPLRAFFDLFHHRLLSLFFRAWTKYRPHVLFRPGGKDEFSARLFSLGGLATGGLKESAGLPAVRLLRFVGLLTQKPHSAESLERMASGYFNLPAGVTQFVKRNITLEERQKALLGKQNCRLGEDLAIGAQVPDRMGKFRVSIGPVGYDDYRSFLPGQENLSVLKSIARLFAPDWLDFDVQVVLRGEETPRLGLKLSDDSHLGWTTGFYPRPDKDVAVVFS